MSFFKPWMWLKSAPQPQVELSLAPFVEGISIPTLVVVDMQPFFENSQDANVLSHVGEQMRLFVANGWPIVILEYDSSECGSTDRRLRKIVKPSFLRKSRYRRLAVQQKYANDGSAETLLACRANGFDTSYFRVCGVNTDACVLQTVQGLMGLAPNALIEVIKEACGPKSDFSNYPTESTVAVRTLDEANEAEASRAPHVALLAKEKNGSLLGWNGFRAAA